MRIPGQEIKGPNVETIIIPRGDGSPIVFKAQAVLDYDDFDRLCPEPKAPMIQRPGQAPEQDLKDKNYNLAWKQRTKLQTYYLFLKSLEATPVEWESIDINIPETWMNFEKELKAAGFSQVERNLITQGCMAANCLSESKIEEARKRFIQSQEVQVLDDSSRKDV